MIGALSHSPSRCDARAGILSGALYGARWCLVVRWWWVEGEGGE